MASRIILTSYGSRKSPRENSDGPICLVAYLHPIMTARRREPGTDLSQGPALELIGKQVGSALPSPAPAMGKGRFSTRSWSEEMFRRPV